jgi:ABC-type glutathione transport system ATPase component
MTATTNENTSVDDLVVEQLRVKYRRQFDKLAVADASFVVHAGEAVGVVGESGSGKSTLISAALGLIPSRQAEVTASKATYGGTRLLGKTDRADAVLGRRIGIVFQDPFVALNPLLTVEHQLTDHMRFHLGISYRAARTRAVRLLDEVGIDDAKRRIRAYPHELSGGMVQRVTIALALACDPSLLVADEATTALDPTVQANIVQLLKDTRESRGLGLIWITHDLALLTHVAERALVMAGGRIVEEGPLEELYRQPRHEATMALMENANARWN